MSFEEGNPPCRKRTTVGNRSGVILPRRASVAAARTPTGRVVAVVVRVPTIAAAAVSGVGTTLGGPTVDGVVRAENARPTTGGVNGNREIPVVVTDVVPAAMVPPRPAGRGAAVTRDAPRGAGVRDTWIGRVPGGSVPGVQARRTGRVATTSVAETGAHSRGGALAGEVGHVADGTTARKGRGAGRPPTAEKVTVARAGVRRSATGGKNAVRSRGAVEARGAVGVSTADRHARTSRTCRTRSRPPISTHRFAGICSAWTRAMPKPSPGIW